MIQSSFMTVSGLSVFRGTSTFEFSRFFKDWLFLQDDGFGFHGSEIGFKGSGQVSQVRIVLFS